MNKAKDLSANDKLYSLDHGWRRKALFPIFSGEPKDDYRLERALNLAEVVPEKPFSFRPLEENHLLFDVLHGFVTLVSERVALGLESYQFKGLLLTPVILHLNEQGESVDYRLIQVTGRYRNGGGDPSRAPRKPIRPYVMRDGAEVAIVPSREGHGPIIVTSRVRRAFLDLKATNVSFGLVQKGNERLDAW